MQKREYCVYMLQCKDGHFYIGITSRLEVRIAEHNAGIHPTSYTYPRRPVQLVYVARFDEVHDAIAYETHLKKWSHTKKAALVAGNEELLHQLSQCGNQTNHILYKLKQSTINK